METNNWFRPLVAGLAFGMAFAALTNAREPDVKNALFLDKVKEMDHILYEDGKAHVELMVSIKKDAEKVAKSTIH